MFLYFCLSRVLVGVHRLRSCGPTTPVISPLPRPAAAPRSGALARARVGSPVLPTAAYM